MIADRVGGSFSQRARLILYHKHPVSARTRFLRLRDGRVCAFDPLPGDAEVMPSGCARPFLIVHPAWLLKGAERWLGLATGSLVLDGEFREQVGGANEPVLVYLAHFDSIDPPFAKSELRGCEFIALTDARTLPAAELELLRRAYKVIMED